MNEPPIQPPPPPSSPPPPQIPPTVNYQNGPLTEYIPTKDEKNMAMLAWLLSILTGWIGPLIIWLMKKDESRFIDFHGKQALYLHVGLIIAMFLLYITCIGILLAIPLAIAAFVFSIIATIKASNGEWYRCPLISWFIKQ